MIQSSNLALVVAARQLESLVRLSEARARLELREEVTCSDAEDVVDLLREVAVVDSIQRSGRL